jgi:hypothetical protein
MLRSAAAFGHRGASMSPVSVLPRCARLHSGPLHCTRRAAQGQWRAKQSRVPARASAGHVLGSFPDEMRAACEAVQLAGKLCRATQAGNRGGGVEAAGCSRHPSSARTLCVARLTICNLPAILNTQLVHRLLGVCRSAATTKRCKQAQESESEMGHSLPLVVGERPVPGV